MQKNEFFGVWQWLARNKKAIRVVSDGLQHSWCILFQYNNSIESMFTDKDYGNNS